MKNSSFYVNIWLDKIYAVQKALDSHKHLSWLYTFCIQFLPTAFWYITVLPSCASAGGVAPRAFPYPSRVTAVCSCIGQLGVVREREGMAMRGLWLPVLTVKTTFSSPFEVIVVSAIASETPVDFFSFCVVWCGERERARERGKERERTHVASSLGYDQTSVLV